MRVFENNQVSVTGEIISAFQFSHATRNENFYTIDVRIERNSGTSDYIPVLISDKLMDISQDYTGKFVCISGQFRSHNKCIDNKMKLLLHIFAGKIEFVDDEKPDNQIFLDGYICKPTIYRETPLGREIANILLAVNRSYGKTDYIPCICWERNAKFASILNVGDRIRAVGRIQSRVYKKTISDTEFEIRTAYEISISDMEIVEEEDENDLKNMM